ncbi:MAG: radical SAM protein [bacterium]
MKIVFVAIATENLAIEFLSSFLKKNGHEVEVVFDPRLFASEAVTSKKLANVFDITKEIILQVNEKKPDIVGFSVFTFNYQRSLALAREIKKKNNKVPIIFGGIHPTSVPELVIEEDCVDIVCIGEGEYALLELLQNINSGESKTNIKNLWFKEGKKIIKNPCRPLINDLDTLPFPDKELFYNIYPGFIKNDYYTASSRGCPFACTFCANNVLHKVYRGLGKSVRRRSPQNVINELIQAKEKFSIRQITFVDDVFVQDIGWLEEFARAYKEKINLPYIIITHYLFVTTQLVKLLVDSGCYFLLFGIQSASVKTRKETLKRSGTNEDIEKASLICHEVGLRFSVDHIFNIPGEGIKEQVEALELYNRIRPTVINSYWIQYFPGTAIITKAVETGIIKEEMVEKINRGLTSTSLVVGLGNKDSFNPDLVYANFQFFFMLLPILPKSFTNKVIQHKLYLMPFKSPMIINIGIKCFINFISKRGSVYWGIIKSIFYFMRRNIALKDAFKEG